MSTKTNLLIPPPTSPIKLIQVTENNRNKFYDMYPQGDTFRCEYARVGQTPAIKTYPITEWAKIYRDKVYRKNEPYKDVTHLVKKTATRSGHAPIKDAKVDVLFNQLLAFAKRSVTENYTISSDAVTKAQVVEAQALMDELTKLATIGSDMARTNRLLMDLYQVIPRRMKNVRDHILKSSITDKPLLQAFREIIDGEQKTLDVMAGQVQMAGVDIAETDDAPLKTILDALGLIVSCGTAADEAIAKRAMGPDAHEFKAVYVVEHPTSRTRYTKFLGEATNKKTELFWHGSRNENWISILQQGLLIRPSNAILTGAMFGSGIYGADKYRKSAGYTSLSGARWTGGGSNRAYLALLDFHVGRQLDITRHTHECYTYNAAVMKAKGKDSVFAHGGADLINNEYIVYDSAQTTIRYLVEVGR